MSVWTSERVKFNDLHERLVGLGALATLAGSETGERTSGKQMLLKSTSEPPTITEVTFSPDSQVVTITHFRTTHTDVVAEQGFMRDFIDPSLSPAEQLDQVTNGFGLQETDVPGIGLRKLEADLDAFRPYEQ